MAKNVENDWLLSSDHEKLYFSPSKNQILGSKFFRQKLKWKKFRYNWNIELAENVEYDSAWSAEYEKQYLSQSKK